MPKKEQGGFKIQNTEDIGKIPHHADREFGRYLLSLGPHINIGYETVNVTHTDTENRKSSTRPDFHLQFPKSGNEAFVEITCGVRGEIDPKAKQREIMARELPQTPYIVLYADQLYIIQRAHTHLDFFDGINVPKNDTRENSEI